MTDTMNTDRDPRFNEGFVATYVQRALTDWGYADAASHTDDLTKPATVTFNATSSHGDTDLDLTFELTVRQVVARTERERIHQAEIDTWVYIHRDDIEDHLDELTLLTKEGDGTFYGVDVNADDFGRACRCGRKAHQNAYGESCDSWPLCEKTAAKLERDVNGRRIFALSKDISGRTEFDWDEIQMGAVWGEVTGLNVDDFLPVSDWPKPEETEVVDLVGALRASVEAAKTRRTTRWQGPQHPTCDWRDADHRQCTRSAGHPGDHVPEEHSK